jgi:hypothetical protein
MKHAIQRARVPRFECMTHGPHLEYGICEYIAETRVVVGLRNYRLATSADDIALHRVRTNFANRNLPLFNASINRESVQCNLPLTYVQIMYKTCGRTFCFKHGSRGVPPRAARVNTLSCERSRHARMGQATRVL